MVETGRGHRLWPEITYDRRPLRFDDKYGDFESVAAVIIWLFSLSTHNSQQETRVANNGDKFNFRNPTMNNTLLRVYFSNEENINDKLNGEKKDARDKMWISFKVYSFLEVGESESDIRTRFTIIIYTFYVGSVVGSLACVRKKLLESVCSAHN